MKKGQADDQGQPDACDFPSVTIRCPQCGSFLREVDYAAGAFTVVACGPCGESFRLSTQWDDWIAAPSRELAHANARALERPRARSKS